MGMLGRWISKPFRMNGFDEVLGSVDKSLEIIKQVHAGKMFLDFRNDLGFTSNHLIVNRAANQKVLNNNLQTMLDVDEHIAQHWLDEDGEGWWRFEPSEEIRTATFLKVAELVIHHKGAKPINNLWLCPNASHMETAIIDGPHEITVLHLTPPEGSWKLEPAPSRHRSGYLKKVRKYLLNETMHSVEMLSDTSVRLMNLEAIEGADPFPAGSRIRISNEEAIPDPYKVDSAAFRTVVSTDGTDLHLRPARSRNGGGSLPSGKLKIQRLKDLTKEPASETELKRREPQEIWTVSSFDRAPTANVTKEDTPVVGATVHKLVGEVEFPLRAAGA